MISDESCDFLLEEDGPAAYATAPPSGVLSVHIKLLRDINEGHISEPYPEVYVRVKVGSFVKSTKTVLVEKGVKVVVDDLKHFSVKVCRKRSDPSNEVRFDLVLVESPHVHRIVGHHDMHLYDIIKHLYVAGARDLTYREKTIATVDLEMCFAYGIFGYGCCHQLQNRQKSISDIVGHSLLLRVEPPETRCASNAGHVMTAVHTGYPEFINFPVKSEIGPSVGDGGGAPGCPGAVGAGPRKLEPVILTRTMRKRLHRIQTDYAKQENRVQRKKFLERLILRNVHEHHAIEEKFTGDGEEEEAEGAHDAATKDETYGTDDDYAQSATDLKELMSSMLTNAPGLVSRAPAVRHVQPSLLSIGEEEDDTDGDSISSELQVPQRSSAHEDGPSRTRHQAPRDARRRSTLAELPGVLVRAVANRLTSWRSSRWRSVAEPVAVVVAGDAAASSSHSVGGRSSVTAAQFRSRLAKTEREPDV